MRVCDSLSCQLHSKALVAPHIGHLYSMIIADIFARWEKLRSPSRPTLFTTGTDEHGLKIEQAASAQNMTPLQLSDITSQQFSVRSYSCTKGPLALIQRPQNLAMSSGLNFTSFIRTTDPRHAKAVEDIWVCSISQC